MITINKSSMLKILLLVAVLTITNSYTQKSFRVCLTINLSFLILINIKINEERLNITNIILVLKNLFY